MTEEEIKLDRYSKFRSLGRFEEFPVIGGQWQQARAEREQASLGCYLFLVRARISELARYQVLLCGERIFCYSRAVMMLTKLASIPCLLSVAMSRRWALMG